MELGKDMEGLNAVAALDGSSKIVAEEVYNSSIILGPYDVKIYSTLILSLTTEKAYTGLSGVFEISDDGVNYYAIKGTDVSDNSSTNSITTLSNVAKLYYIPVIGAAFFRFRTTALATGTASIKISASTVSNSPSASTNTASSNQVTTLLGGTLAVTTVAAALVEVSTPVQNVLIQNDIASANDVYIGNATSQPIVLQPGNDITVEIDNLTKIFVKVLTGSGTINYLGGL
jgi:hypothetical protein